MNSVSAWRTTWPMGLVVERRSEGRGSWTVSNNSRSLSYQLSGADKSWRNGARRTRWFVRRTDSLPGELKC